MIVDDLDVFRAGGRPAEAQSKLIVHANAVLTGPIALELLKAITGGDTEVIESVCDL